MLPKLIIAALLAHTAGSTTGGLKCVCATETTAFLSHLLAGVAAPPRSSLPKMPSWAWLVPGGALLRCARCVRAQAARTESDDSRNPQRPFLGQDPLATRIPTFSLLPCGV